MRNEDTIGSDSDFRDDFIRGAARAFFVTAYADFVEDKDADEDRSEYPQPGPGEDWTDFTPPTPPNAYALAGELWAGLVVENRQNAPAGVYSLAEQAATADGYSDGASAVDAERFGHYLAMQAMGHGVSWFDDHKKFPLVVPHMECSSFTFSTDAYQPE
jgi:hypothetical protein